MSTPQMVIFPTHSTLFGPLKKMGFAPVDLVHQCEDDNGIPGPIPPQLQTLLEACYRKKALFVILATTSNDLEIARLSELIKSIGINDIRIVIVNLGKIESEDQAEDEIKRALNLSTRGEATEPEPFAAFSPFPVECLPDSLRDFVMAVAGALRCDPAFIAVPALVVCAGAIGGSRVLELKPGWQEPACLWGALVAESGSMKTPALDVVQEPLWNLHNDRNQDFLAKQGEFQRDLALYEASLRKGDTSSEKAPDPPRLERCIVGDVTIQRLAEILHDTPRGTLCAVDELSGWFQNLTRYASGGSDLPLWLSTHSGAPLQIDRKGGVRSIFIKKALVSIVGGIQPGILKRHLTKELAESGATARFLFLAPPKWQKVWRDSGIDPKPKALWSRLVGNLLELEGMAGAEGCGSPGVIHLDPKARDLWVEFFESNAVAQASATGVWASFLAKMEAQVARLALILAVVDRASKNREDLLALDPVWMEAGIVLGRWFIGERKRLERIMAQPEPGSVVLVDRLAMILREAGPDGISKTAIHESLGRNQAKAQIDKALGSLKLQGLAREVLINTKGRPAEVWQAVGGFLPG